MYLYIKYDALDSVLATGFAVFDDADVDSLEEKIRRANNARHNSVITSRRLVGGWDDVRAILTSTAWSRPIDRSVLERCGNGSIVHYQAHAAVIVPGQDQRTLVAECNNRKWHLSRVGDSDAYSVSLRTDIAGVRGL